MDDEIEVPIARAVFRFDLDDRLPPPDAAAAHELVARYRFEPVCQLQVAMASRGMLARDGWEIVDGWMLFEPVADGDTEWAIVWVGVGTRDPEAAAEVLHNILRQIAEQEDGDPEPDLDL